MPRPTIAIPNGVAGISRPEASPLVVLATTLASSRRLLAAAPGSDAPGWTRALGACTPLLLIPTSSFAVARITGTSADYALFAWLTTGVFVAGLQMGALLIRIERRAAKQNASLATLIDALPFSFVMADAAGRVQSMNRIFADQFGLDDPRRHIGTSWNELAQQLSAQIEPEDLAWLRSPRIQRLAALDRVPIKEYHFLDGRITRAHVRNVYASDQRRLGQLWLLDDVTEERRLQAELSRSRQLETLGRLAGGVAHDFNNQLTAMLGNSEMVRESLPPDDPRRSALADLEQAALYCSRIARDLLDFSQPAPRQRSATRLDEFLPDVLARLRDALSDGVDLEFEPDRDVAPISVDRTQLERVVENLVRNAQDAVGDAGTIRVEVRQHPGVGAPQVVLSVNDDGSGMDAATRERIFDPFFSTKPVGNGLGLAIVYGIVTSHGGEVGVESKPGAGSRFETRWPVCAASARKDCDAPAAALARGSETLLLVEDEAAVRRLMRATLERAGYGVISASSGEDALAAHAQHASSVALALLDVSMPGLSGPQVLARLRERSPDLPAIFMSGNFADAGTLADEPMLPKPFRSAELLALVRSTLDAQHDR